MAEQKDQATREGIQNLERTEHAGVTTDYLDTSGDEENTVWDNMVHALKPDLTPHKKSQS